MKLVLLFLLWAVPAQAQTIYHGPYLLISCEKQNVHLVKLTKQYEPAARYWIVEANCSDRSRTVSFWWNDPDINRYAHLVKPHLTPPDFPWANIGYGLLAFGLLYLGWWSGFFRWFYERYLKDNSPPPYQFPTVQRFEGTWMVAPSGAGKTTALKTLIWNDIAAVKRDEASVVVMDSTGLAKGSLLHSFAYSKALHQDRVLHEKLILLEPDPEYPLALNLFDIGQKRIGNLSPIDREIALNTAQEMMEFILGGLLGAEMTEKQGGVFRYLIQALMVIPDATIFTLAELMENEGYEKHRPHILKLDEWTRDFFEKRFRQIPKQKNAFNTTKQELYWRIDAILSDLTFRRMFSHPQNKLDLFTELQSSKIILINTNRALLRTDRVETLGRYFIASLMQAIEQRGFIDRDKRKPVYIYLDEAHEIIAREPKIADLLNTVARKNNVAFTFAHQAISQIEDRRVLDALSNVAVRYASRNEADARYLASILKTEPEILTNHAQGEFSTFVRGLHTETHVVNFTPINTPTISQSDFDTFKVSMRKYTSKPVNRPLPKPPLPDDDHTTPITDADL